MGGEMLWAIGGLGGLYALCGVAVWLGLRLTGGINLGLAGCAGLAGLAMALGIGPVAAVLAGGVAGAAAGCGLELAVLRWAGAGAQTILAGLMAWVALDGLSAAISQALPARLAAGGAVGWVVVLLVVAVGGVAWMDRRPRFGLALRAAAADPVAAVLGGVDVPLLRLAVAAVAGGLVGLAVVLGGLLGLGPGWVLVLHGAAAALLGRRFGLAGVVGAGLALGAAERLTGGADLLGYAVLLAALLAPSRAAPRPA